MNYQNHKSELDVLLSVAILALSFFIIKKRSRHTSCRLELENKISQGLSLPVELLRGTFRIVQKINPSFLIVTHIGRPDGLKLKVSVPRKMFERIKEGDVYFFRFDYKNHEIHFDSNEIHTECSDLFGEDMAKNLFRLKTRILRDLVL